MKLVWFPEKDISWLVCCYTKLTLIIDCRVKDVNAHSITQKPQIAVAFCGLATLTLAFSSKEKPL